MWPWHESRHTTYLQRISSTRACLKIRMPIKYWKSPGVYLALNILLVSAQRLRASIRVRVHVRRCILLQCKLSCRMKLDACMNDRSWDQHTCMHVCATGPSTNTQTQNTYKPLLSIVSLASSRPKLSPWRHRPSSSSCTSVWTGWSPLRTAVADPTARPRRHRRRPTARARSTRWSWACVPTCWTC